MIGDVISMMCEKCHMKYHHKLMNEKPMFILFFYIGIAVHRLSTQNLYMGLFIH